MWGPLPGQAAGPRDRLPESWVHAHTGNLIKSVPDVWAKAFDTARELVGHHEAECECRFPGPPPFREMIAGVFAMP